MEKVYLSDWLFNAGITGFLLILFEGRTDLKEGENLLSNEGIVYIGKNYIEFERDVLVGFSDKYFDSAYERYKRTDEILERCKDILKKLEYEAKEIFENDIEESYKDIKKRTTNFSMLKNFLGEKFQLPSLNEVKSNPEVFKEYLSRILEIIEKNKQGFKENDVKIYLGRIYGQKNFLNRAITSDYKVKFKEEFEDKIIEGTNRLEKNILCMNCGERNAKEKVAFDTGLSPFTGVNLDALNFFWNFNAKLPLCEICELMYFCTFRGFTKSAREDKYFFVNSDTSVIDLYKNNVLLQSKLRENLDENIFIDFFKDLLISEKLEKSNYSLQNIAFIELDLSNKDVLPKVFSFNISRSKAEFLKDQSGRNFKDISNRFYVIKDKYRDITLELLEKILTNNLSYDYLSFLDYLFVENLKGTNNSVKIYYNPFNLHTLNLIISDYFQKFKKTGGEIMTTSRSEEQLWFMFKKGEELAEKLINEEHENKIPSITYKLLSHLRTENVDGFMNLVFRLYLSYGLEIPSLFVKAISEKDVFLSYGYSFVNGILTRYTSKKKIIDEEVKR